MHISSYQGGARGLERLACLKYYNIWKNESRLTSGLNAAENTDYMKKISNKSCLELNSLQKSHQARIYLPPTTPTPWSEARRLGRLMWLKYYNVQ